jgi:hypothetical protein
MDAGLSKLSAFMIFCLISFISKNLQHIKLKMFCIYPLKFGFATSYILNGLGKTHGG